LKALHNHRSNVMKRFILALLAVPLAWLGLAAVPAAAQNVYPYQQPRFGPGWQTPLSPWLNMLIPGNAAVNYYALVEPQFQRRQYRNQLNVTIQGLINEIPQPPGIMSEEDFNAPMPATGHPTAFNYTGSYFTTLTGQPVPSLGGYAQRTTGAGGMMGPGRRPGLMGGGTGMMRPGMGVGAAGTWPNMRAGMWGR
jgi:hypothetical protein